MIDLFCLLCIKSFSHGLRIVFNGLTQVDSCYFLLFFNFFLISSLGQLGIELRNLF